MKFRKRAIGDLYLAASIIFIYLESFQKMHLRKRAIGDLYLASSVIFIFLTFVAVISRKNAMAIWFLSIGMLIALFGMKTKKVMIEKEENSFSKKSKKAKPKKK